MINTLLTCDNVDQAAILTRSIRKLLHTSNTVISFLHWWMKMGGMARLKILTPFH